MIPFADLPAQYKALKPEIDAAIVAVLEKAQFILGPAVAEFERDFASYCQVSEAVALNSGTSALHLALLAAGVGKGDEVITVPFTFIATASAVEYAGATPVFVDVDPDYLTMDPAKIEAAITPRTKAIIPVHLFGQPADMDPILDIARRHKLVVIEDACQAHGADYKGRRCGSIGDIACFSFYPGKNLGAYGEGGAAVTSNPAHAKAMRAMRDWGQTERYTHTLKGFNYRMDGVQGAVLGVKLKYLDRWTDARGRRAEAYATALKGSAAVLPGVRPGVRHVFHCFVVRLQQRDAWRAHLDEAGVQTGVHYPIPIHLQPVFRGLGYAPGAFPVSERAAAEVLSLPMFPELTVAQIDTVAGLIRAGLPAVLPTLLPTTLPTTASSKA
jgi:dTDP-4-amino-4,6-dideoxygalactose transaminase